MRGPFLWRDFFYRASGFIYLDFPERFFQGRFSPKNRKMRRWPSRELFSRHFFLLKNVSKMLPNRHPPGTGRVLFPAAPPKKRINTDEGERCDLKLARSFSGADSHCNGNSSSLREQGPFFFFWTRRKVRGTWRKVDAFIAKNAMRAGAIFFSTSLNLIFLTVGIPAAFGKAPIFFQESAPQARIFFSKRKTTVAWPWKSQLHSGKSRISLKNARRRRDFFFQNGKQMSFETFSK